MGADGAYGVNARLDALAPAGPGTTCRFASGQPSTWTRARSSTPVARRPGGHNDIVHAELSWVVLAASGIV